MTVGSSSISKRSGPATLHLTIVSLLVLNFKKPHKFSGKGEKCVFLQALFLERIRIRVSKTLEPDPINFIWIRSTILCKSFHPNPNPCSKLPRICCYPSLKWSDRKFSRSMSLNGMLPQMCNTDCDTSGPATLQEKNKKNSLSGQFLKPYEFGKHFN